MTDTALNHSVHIDDLDQFQATRDSFHQLAEHILAPDLYRNTGKIGLRVTSHEFGQPEFIIDGCRHRARIDGERLAIDTGDGEHWHSLTTLEAAAACLHLPLDTGTPVFQPTTNCEAKNILRIDSRATEELHQWFRFVNEALERVRSRHAQYTPTITQLWPEHFDLAFSMIEANFGGSPGDEHRPEPYLYVGPWAPADGTFWNESFGAAISYRDVPTRAAAEAFFEEGIRHLTAH